MTAAAQTGSHRSLRPVPPLVAGHAARGVLGRLQEVVRAQPDAVAVRDNETVLSYRQLARQAAAVRAAVADAVAATDPMAAADPAEAAGPMETAGQIEAAGPMASGTQTGGAEPIAVLYRHAPAAVAAIVGVLASGHPLLVLDQRTPPARLRAFVDRVGVRFVVADEEHAGVAEQLVPHVLLPGAPTSEPGHHSAASPADSRSLWSRPPEPGSVALLAFTSGSTGTPKVVLNDHRMVVLDAWHNARATDAYTAGDVLAHTLPMSSHAGLLTTFAGLLVGAEMALLDVRVAGVEPLPGWLAASAATVLQASPAILRALIGIAPAAEQLHTLRVLALAGETVHGRDIQAARALLPAGCTIRNRYGCSETGVIAEFIVDHEVPAEQSPGGALPVGFPLGETRIDLLDEGGRPAGAGEPGTIMVTRAVTALGYWSDPAGTAAGFTDHPDGTRSYRTSDVGRWDEAGRLHLLGRRDHSVKIRGYLVEPGEVDAALFALPQVREAVTVGRPRGSDGPMQLVAYVVPDAPRPSPAAIRAGLRQSLPAHMVPETVLFLPALPRTDRGKLDRAALPDPPPVVTGQAAERLSEWESVVASVWERVLDVDVIGPDDDFFELGGDSLAAEQLISAMVRELGVPAAEVASSALVQAPTLAEFCRRMQRRSTGPEQTLIPLQPGGSRPPLFLVAGAGGLGVGLRPLIRHLAADQPVWALQAKALERRGLPDWSVRAAARRHVAAIRRLQPEGPYLLGGHSFGGLVALEMAHQLRAAGQDVDLLVVLDSFPPDPALYPRHRPGRSPGRRLRDLVALASTGVIPSAGAAKYWRFHRQSMALARFYRCPPYPGRAVVIVADSPERQLRSAWASHLSGPWQLVDIGGDHLSMMREPYAGRIAAAIEEGLRTAAGYRKALGLAPRPGAD